MSNNSIGWAEEHRNNVAERWKKKFQKSGMTEKQFSTYMKKTMIEYGWTEADVDKMVKRALKQ